jgi:hypothetical protein
MLAYYLIIAGIMLLFLLTGCTSAPNGAINLGKPYVKMGYKLKGFHGKVHLYEENVPAIADSMPMYRLSLYHFCLNHYVGENISVRVSVINGDTTMNYIVTK